MKKRTLRVTAYTLLFSLAYQLVYPMKALALTTGPSQPEVQSFEPVGTTEMVNMFTGDFNYNIPLMDVEGYPVNIAYHSGVGIEQEASWVGLGWNINPGEINRSVRGLPDDFNGETIEKQLHIKDEKNFRIGAGVQIGGELLGKDLLSGGLGVGMYINNNNYKGVGVGVNISASISLFNTVNAGGSVGVGSQTGADVDLNAGVGYHNTKSAEDGGGGGYNASIGVSSGFNSRSGLKDISFSVSGGMTVTGQKKTGNGESCSDPGFVPKTIGTSASVNTTGYSTTIPVGLQNYVPVITNASAMSGFQFQTRLGAEAWYLYPNLYFNAGITTVHYDPNGSRNGYGYLYMENAPKDGEGILDFTRDKDGTYNKTLQNLPAGALTYDIYAVNGQGTGGMFRPFRNDIGAVYDPLTSSSSDSKDLLLEFGYGNLFEIGTDVNLYDNVNTSGPWNKMSFGSSSPGKLYEKTYFKQAGEPTYNQQSEATSLFNDNPVYLREDMQTLTGNNGGAGGTLPDMLDGKRIYWDNNNIGRTSRANLLTYLTAGEASLPELAQYKQYRDYQNSNVSNNSRYFDPVENRYDRYQDGNVLKAQRDHISEFTQTQADGRRYVYGIPAMNNVSREATFSVNEGSNVDMNSGLVTFNAGDDGPGNGKGRENYFSGTNTPAYAHSYLLTSVLSNDYVDVMGDGPTDDDPGTYVKFNYTLTDKDYRWRTPYDATKAQYNPGFYSDDQDGKGNYMMGSREQWHLRTIETKNYVAEFYVSQRADGKGISAAILPYGSNGNGSILSGASAYNTARAGGASVSYKLDSIKLYNKHDRYLNEDNAVPVKTVIFSYSYRLCPGTPNSIIGSQTLTNADGSTYTTQANGKLTLEKIYIRYGKSDKNLLSPYVFSYNTPNPAYDFAAKDRWGNYKRNDPALTNYEYPYVNQDPVTTDSLTSWNMTDIKLPSGGNIHVTYESDDYAYVQDRRAMQMFRIEGIGSSDKLEHKSILYENTETVQDYVYFKRRPDMEKHNLSLKDNYLEGQDLLCYNFDIDITGTGKYEHIKGYANIADVGLCSNDTNYAYIKLKEENVNGKQIHPATLYGLNMARYYLPHILFPGSSGSDKDIVLGLAGAVKELTHMRKPFVNFLKDGKGRNIKIAKSWVRLQSPGMKKKGGGVRVKKLELQDNWARLSGNDASGDASYGKQYDYTIQDSRYGTISSGVASYEPMIGNDENPFRKPVPWQADAGRWLPAIDFFQEEPFGESFFPAPDVGYSSIRVQSVHVNEGRSSQSEDEYLFYTAKDFPVSVRYTDKNDPGPVRTKSLRRQTSDEKALQGYTMVFNDMHGKPRAINNYVLHTDPASGYVTREQITGMKYNYQTDPSGKLNNTVTAMVRTRSAVNNYSVKQVTLGKEMDLTVDSREKYFRSFNRDVSINLNVAIWGIYPVPIPTSFFPDKEDEQTFKMQITTKIIQQYGMVKSTEVFDHGARTLTENLVYDAETGGVLLTQTNNEFNDKTYDLKHPAYLAYDGMGAAYTNTGYEEYADSFVVSDFHNGYIYTNNLERFAPGDELEVNTRFNQYKLWVLGIGVNNDTVATPPPVNNGGTGTVMFWIGNTNISLVTFPIQVHFNNTTVPINAAFSNTPACNTSGCAVFTNVPAGSYTISPSFILAEDNTNPVHKQWTGGGMGTITVTNGQCTPVKLAPQGTVANRMYNGKLCALLVAPRYKGEYTVSAPGTNIANWPQVYTPSKKVYIKVIRSGRRNNLAANVQQMVLAQNPYKGNVNDLFGPYTGYSGHAYDSLLAISANTFTDSAVAYDDYDNTIATYSSTGIPGGSQAGHRYTDMNKFVLGYRGTYRPASEYVRFTNRAYSGHARYDGTFNMGQGFWTFVNSYSAGSCGESHDVLQAQPGVVVPTYWKQARATTKYDVFGNAIEEKDALGNYSSAQYGYNKQLPLAVASNTHQDNFFFDGFEDYLMLLPEYIRRAYVENLPGGAYPHYQSSPFLKMFNAYNSQLSTSDPTMMSRYGQRYSIRNATSDVNGGLVITNETSHTGYYALKCNSNASISLSVAAPAPDRTEKFILSPGSKYFVDVWVKPFSATISSIAAQCNITQNGTTYPMAVKTGNIDGWYLLEGTVNIAAGTTGPAAVNIPGGIYFDDARIFPVDANMKSFVYDPVTFKLAAQLDENHFATFYEYDQEGLLVRVKKETDRGIMTISESRRSNAKK